MTKKIGNRDNAPKYIFLLYEIFMFYVNNLYGYFLKTLGVLFYPTFVNKTI